MLRCTKTGNSLSETNEAATVDKLELLGSRPDMNAAPSEPPAGGPYADTVKTNNLRGGSGDETVRVNLIGGRSDRSFGDGK